MHGVANHYVKSMAFANFEKISSHSIASKNNLAIALGIHLSEIDDLLATPADVRYSRLEKPKPNGEIRVVYNPSKLTRKIQTRINSRIFKKIIKWPYFIFGSVPKANDNIPKDYIACANQHKNAGSILKIDIKNFFDNVHEDLVEEIFSNFFKYPIEVSKILTDICCRNGTLCQGAPTSSYLATLCLFSVEPNLVKKIEKKGLSYTRYVDDITVSSKDRNYDFSYIENIIENVLTEKELPVNHKKTHVASSSSESLLVHGLRVNTKSARFPADEVRKIRAAVKNIEIVAKEVNYIRSHYYRREFYKCQGRVNKLARVGHSQHKKFIERLQKIKPLPSNADIEIVKKIIERIKITTMQERSEFWFRRRYNVAISRVYFIRKDSIFKSVAQNLLLEIKKYSPPKSVK